MVIRRITPEDYAEQYSLIQEFRETEFTEEQFREHMGRFPDIHHIWVYEEGSRLLGTITILQEHKFIFNRCTFAHVEDVCVRAEARKKGIGSQLLQHAVQEAKNRNCKKITLVCNEKVAPFQEANQFERRGVQQSQLLRSDD